MLKLKQRRVKKEKPRLRRRRRLHRGIGEIIWAEKRIRMKDLDDGKMKRTRIGSLGHI